MVRMAWHFTMAAVLLSHHDCILLLVTHSFTLQIGYHGYSLVYTFDGITQCSMLSHLTSQRHPALPFIPSTLT